MHKSKSIFFICLIIISFMLSSCTMFSVTNINDLLQVPALGQDQGNIQKALEEYLGEKPQYKFPKEGENNTPLLLIDLDGDGKDEAVLFFTTSGDSPEGESRYNNVYMAVLEETNGAWKVTQEAKGLKSDIASVDIVDMFEDGSRQLVVGYANNLLNNKQLALYSYKNNILDTVEYNERYDKYVLADFTGRGGIDLAVAFYSEEESCIVIRFITGQDGYFQLKTDWSVSLSENIESCIAITPSIGSEGERLLVIDGIYGTVVSIILKLADNGERFYVPENYSVIMNKTARRSRILISRDIDEDGIIEIPIGTGEEIETRLNDKSLHYIEWRDFINPYEGEEAPAKEFGLFDADRKFYICLPNYWKGNIEVVDGEKKGEWSIKKKDSTENLIMLKIYSYEDSVPENAFRVPGTRSVYIVAGEDLKEWESKKIKLTILN